VVQPVHTIAKSVTTYVSSDNNTGHLFVNSLSCPKKHGFIVNKTKVTVIFTSGCYGSREAFLKLSSALLRVPQDADPRN
jgi:hypothetical protein